MDSTWQIVILCILLILSGFFSASETALMSLSKIKLRHMVEENVKGADLIDKLLTNPNKLLGAILIGNNIANIAASSLATSIAINNFGEGGIGIATLIMTVLVLIFGEITPKSLAAINSDKISLKVCKPIYFLTIILNPIVIVFTKLSSLAIRLFGGKIENKTPFITEDELKTLIDVGHEEGVLEGEERELINNVFEFSDTQVVSVMTPRTDLIAVDTEISYDELYNLFKEHHFSKIIVYNDTIDDIIGVLHVKDLFLFNGDKNNFDITKFLREPYFTYEYKKTTELFKEMRKNRISLAVVLDEYGGTAGIVTTQDLVEEIVGDIADEYDEQEEDVEVVREDEYIVEGSTKIEDLNELIGTNIESEDFDSIGGFVIGEFRGFPKQGDKLELQNMVFIVEEIDKNRIKKLRILT